MLLRPTIVAIILMALSSYAHAWVHIAKFPPKDHALLPGTVQIFKSDGGAVRYLEVVESTVCKPVAEAISPSATFKNPISGLYKEYKSPSGVVGRWPVSFDTECGKPESDEPNPPSEEDFTGLIAVAINPTFAEPNDCTYAEFHITKKNLDGTYLFKFIRLYDAAVIIDGRRVCPYK